MTAENTEFVDGRALSAEAAVEAALEMLLADDSGAVLAVRREAFGEAVAGIQIVGRPGADELALATAALLS